MKIFDCFMYFDEEIVLDVRLNTLNQFVDYFVIVESKFNHRGEPRDLQFNHKKFEKFKDKIIYLIYDFQPKEIETVNNEDSNGEKSRKFILNAATLKPYGIPIPNDSHVLILFLFLCKNSENALYSPFSPPG